MSTHFYILSSWEIDFQASKMARRLYFTLRGSIRVHRSALFRVSRFFVSNSTALSIVSWIVTWVVCSLRLSVEKVCEASPAPWIITCAVCWQGLAVQKRHDREGVPLCEASPLPCLTNQGMIHIIESCESSLVSCAFLTACSYYTWRQCSWMLRRWFARGGTQNAGSKAWRQCSCDHEQYSSRSPAAHTGLAREGARQQLQRQLEKQPWKLGILYEIQLIIIAS